ncbi:MAG: ATP-binding cassette domain-containing protein, partial [Solirubrobacterales bacterium]|nr:ATP-binding cassette domain-containing protein [Solirubrobacterales bacterium]
MSEEASGKRRGHGGRAAAPGADQTPPRATLRDLLAILGPYRGQLALATAVAAGAILAVVAVPLLVGKGVDEIQDGDEAGILRAALAIGAVGLIGSLSQAARQLLAGRLGLRVVYDLRQRYYAHLQDLDLETIGSLPTGQLVSRGTVDLRPIRFFLGAGIPSLAQDVGSILLAALVMFTLDADLAALTLAPVPVLVVAILLYDRAATPRLAEVRQRIGELARIAQENIVGVRLVKAFSRERIESKRFRSSAAEMLASALTATRIEARFTPTLAAIPSLGLLVVLLYGGHQAIDGEISVGEFTSFFTYALLLIGPAATIAYWMTMVQQAIASTDRIAEILERRPRIASAPGSTPVPRRAEVSFRDVRAGHRGHLALEGIELEIHPRRAVAVVGASGSGKSTLLGLINRLHDPRSGSVEFGGRPATELDLTSLRRSVAVAADDDFLFSGTVGENIAFGRPTASEEEIR